jgi:hypothetical protein
LSKGFIMRFEPYGEYVLPQKMLGFYGQLPIAHVFDFSGSDATGMGNLGLGAFALPLHNSELILCVGITLPSGASSGDGEITNMLSAYERMTDLVMVAPKYTTLRLSASTVQESAIAFFRADLGFDLAVDKPSTGRGVFLRGNLAAGVRAPGIDLSAELVNIGNLDGSGSLSQRFVHTAAVALRTRGPQQFCAGMVFPLDHSVRGEIWIVSAGYQFATN